MTIEHRPNSNSVSAASRGKRAYGTVWLDAALDRISLDPARFLTLLIVLGVVALTWVALVGALLLRPSAPPPQAPAALPPLAVSLPPSAEALPPLAEVESNSYGQIPIGLGETQKPESVPVNPAVPHEAGPEPTPPAAASTRVRPQLPHPSEPPRIQIAPPPPTRPVELRPIARPAEGYDRLTAVYDIAAHTVYLPDGTRLEAHSGLGDRLDDPRFVSERNRGPTPPGVYALTLRESLFHGVQALRLTPLGGDDVFGRSGLLAHPYMLGPSGDSNGCVSFKYYDAFLRAYQNGQIRRLAVVAQWTEAALRGPRRSLGD
jgi:hypothetical protein